MATPVFDGTGSPVGWLDGDVIRSISGRHRAFINNGAVVSYSGTHLGTFGNGYFRDRAGHAVAFINGAHGGPLPPLPALPPLPPLFPLAPLRPIPPIPPIPSIASLSWSGLNWEDFLQD